MRLGWLVGVLMSACMIAEPAVTPTPPPDPPPLSTLPPPAIGTPPISTFPPATSAPYAAVTPAPAPTDARVGPRLQELLDDWLAGSGAPGAVLGARLRDGGMAVVAAGNTDDRGGIPVEPGHRFRIGSITKTFVAVVILQLADEGLLDIDDRLFDHLPRAPHARAVTIRHLLGHTSGIPDFGSLSSYRRQLLSAPGRSWSVEDTIELVEDLPLEFEPG
ncbi:MAG: beta-lactamase family protein, partial [Chloroflexota bacterium]|nr:beta-lactamase family protein [Chloroflexota bacterium]